MSEVAQLQAFWNELNALRDRSTRPTLSEIARLAQIAGVSVSEALLQIRRHSEFRNVGSSDIADALAALMSSMCSSGGPTRVLEYTTMPSLLTASLAESIGAPSYVVPDTHIAEALAVLFEGKPASVFQMLEDLEAGSEFDSIICQPPIGRRSSNDNADGFGGESVRQLIPFLAEGGTLYWVTGLGVTFNSRAKNTLAELEEEGFNVEAIIEVAPGAFAGSMIESAVIALRRGAQKKFVGALRDLETALPMAAAFLDGPNKKNGPSWLWLDRGDDRTFADIEQARLLQNLTPRGRHELKDLKSLLISDRVQRADKPALDEIKGAAFLFIPEYAGSRVTADLEEQSVKPNAVYRFPVDPAKANSRFLAQLLNSPYGKQLRASAAKGATIQRTSASDLFSLELPIPDLATQDQIARIDSDVRLLHAAFSDMQDHIDQDWGALSDVAEKIDALKAVLDIDRRVAEWWRGSSVTRHLHFGT